MCMYVCMMQYTVQKSDGRAQYFSEKASKMKTSQIFWYAECPWMAVQHTYRTFFFFKQPIKKKCGNSVGYIAKVRILRCLPLHSRPQGTCWRWSQHGEFWWFDANRLVLEQNILDGLSISKMSIKYHMIILSWRGNICSNSSRSS